MLRKISNITVVIICHSLMFSSFVYADQLALPSGDLIAPQIGHEPLKGSIKANSTQQIKATITDNVGIKVVTLFYRTIGSGNYKRVQMNQVEGTNEFVATLGFEVTVEPGIEYYIQAVDLAGNALLHGYSFSPLKIVIVPDGSVTATAQPATQKELNSSAQAPKQELLLDKEKTNKWLWIGLSVLAVGVIAAVAGGGADDGGTSSSAAETGAINVSVPIPGN